MRLANVSHLLLVLLLSCHQYEVLTPVEGTLPIELNTAATQLYIEDQIFSWRMEVTFQYEGYQYLVSWRISEREDCNSFCAAELKGDSLITEAPNTFSSEIWQGIIENKEEWGNRITEFDPFILRFSFVMPLNPGVYEKNLQNMLGCRKLTLYAEPDYTNLIYSQRGSGGSESLTQLLIENPDILIHEINYVTSVQFNSYSSLVIKKS
ncbi:MAG: hypothetical protein KF763_15705 [Cyclobacteriaceae bacterium]|nr:hypothetical protein [Cyclobacteriaceae bacterium]